MIIFVPLLALVLWMFCDVLRDRRRAVALAVMLAASKAYGRRNRHV